MIEIEAINTVLRFSGRQRVNHVTRGDQTANIALETLTRVRREILNKPYGFNERRLTLQGDITGRVPVTVDWLAIKFPSRRYTTRFDVDEDRTFVWDFQLNDWAGGPIAGVRVTVDTPEFEQIPDPFAYWIAYRAAEEFFYEVNQQPPPYLINESVVRRQVALNSVRSVNLNDATGFTTLISSHFTRT
jgi:hypothetical protein